VTTHTVAGGYARPIHTPHYALPFKSRSYTAKPPGKMEKTGGFALAPIQCRGQELHWHCRGCRTGVENHERPRSDPAIIHPGLAAWYKLGLIGQSAVAEPHLRNLAPCAAPMPELVRLRRRRDKKCLMTVAPEWLRSSPTK
jgi:hypothetical protein